jgi:hypothetical protein
MRVAVSGCRDPRQVRQRLWRRSRRPAHHHDRTSQEAQAQERSMRRPVRGEGRHSDGCDGSLPQPRALTPALATVYNNAAF